MGMITPPVGGLLFVTSVVARVPLARLVRELWPFMWAQVVVPDHPRSCPDYRRGCPAFRIPLTASRRVVGSLDVLRAA